MHNKVKKSVLSLGFASFATVFILFSACTSSSEKQEMIKTNEVIEAEKSLADAKKDYIISYETFKNKSYRKIAENERTIARLKIEVENISKLIRGDLEKNLTALEKKNKMLKNKIRDYKEEGNDQWEVFKIEFNHDMDKLEKDLKDLV